LLEEVSEATGISRTVLLTLEKGEKEQFPAKVYVLAFYKKYASYLGLDSGEILVAYRKQLRRPQKAGRRVDFNTVVTLKRQEEHLVVTILRRLFMPGFLILLGFLFYWLYENYLATFKPSALF